MERQESVENSLSLEGKRKRDGEDPPSSASSIEGSFSVKRPATAPDSQETALNQEMDTVQVDMKNVETKLSNTEHEMKELSQEIKDLNQEIKRQNTEIEHMKSLFEVDSSSWSLRNKGLYVNVNGLRASIERKEASIERKEDERKALRCKEEALQNKEKSLLEEKSKLQAKYQVTSQSQEHKYPPFIPSPHTFRMNGIDLSSSHLSRNSAIEKLLYLLQNQMIVVVSAPAASGKTSLLQLVASCVRCIGFSCLGTSMSGFDLLKAEGLDLIKKESKFKGQDTVFFLFDDAQELYADFAFWATLIKNAPLWMPNNIRFIFAATHLLAGGVQSPVEFESLPKLTRRDLLIDEQEFEELLLSPTGLPLNWRSYTLERVIWQDCGKSVGAISLSCNLIKVAFSKDPRPSETAMLSYFFSRDFTLGMARCFGSRHSAPISPELQEYVVKCLLGVADKQPGVDDERDRLCFDNLIKGGLLVSTNEANNAFKFASPLAKRFFMNHLFPNREISGILPKSLVSLVKDAISLLSSSQLRNSTLLGSFPKEAVFQHLLMYSFAKLTPPECSICPELSEVFPSNDSSPVNERIPGAIDFYLNGDLRWGIEILVNGDGIGEHLDRFAANGKYSGLKVCDYVVVDFRVGKVSKKLCRNPKRITAFFSPRDFSRCSCIIGMDEKPVVLKLAH